jgi:hypothetical protein
VSWNSWSGSVRAAGANTAWLPRSTTIAVLEINLDYRVAFRQGLIDEDVFPPP